MNAPARPLEAALPVDAVPDYLQRGWSIVPAPVRGKGSLVPWRGWQQTRPRRDVWREWARRWPSCNVALITGALSNVVVLDVDPRHGGLDSLVQLERELGELGETAVSITPGGGRHVFFRHPGGRVANSASLLAPGLDVRGDNGLCVLPPSRRADGKAYQWWEGPDALAPMPPWLVARCRPRQGPSLATSTPRTTSLTDDLLRARFEAVVSILNGAGVGSRNSALFWCALRVRDLIAEGAPPALAVDLEDHAVHRGLTRAEAKATITSGLNAEVRS
jgi:hypothetical protein